MQGTDPILPSAGLASRRSSAPPSNTRLSNIFREFCKGGESGADPVATLISWLPDGRCENDAISTATYPGEGSRRARGESPPRGGAHSRPDDEPSHGQSSRHQHLAPAVGHLTARDLHAFLFGESCTPWENPSAAGGKRPRPFDCADTAAAVAAAVAVPPRKSAKRNRNGRGGAETLGGGVSLTDAAGAVAVAEFRKERSEAAAAAAVAGGGFCLLQAYLPPTGARNSTLRCHWAPARPVDPASRSMTDGDDVSGPSLGKDWGCRQELGVSRRAVLADPARKRVMGGLGGGGGGGRSSSCCRWGDAEGKMETGCRERSPDRSALREQERSPESPLIPERSGRRVVERGGENVSRPTLSFSPEDTAIVRSQDSFQRGSLAAENTAGENECFRQHHDASVGFEFRAWKFSAESTFFKASSVLTASALEQACCYLLFIFVSTVTTDRPTDGFRSRYLVVR